MQEHYNRFIREKSDIVFFVFDGQVGGITETEFEVAKNAYKSSTNHQCNEQILKLQE